ncbi:hypothetical protein [Geminicoccus roseus]|uniref:hypothetical protein n=1 Tax=Geminicoccus roseus TaxID=404900 RepID=UPI00041B8F5F|nr:hypothetical protein [Geminicoccus roseus]
MLPVLLHLHVPRASGSSLHAWFRQGLGQGGVARANATEAVRKIVAERQEPRRPAVISGHFAYGVHQNLEGHPYRYALLLRDPVRRVLSLFRYIRGLPAHDLHEVLNGPDMTIARFYAERLPGSGPRNAMVAQLAGVLGSGVTLAPEHLEQACANLFAQDMMYGLAEDPAPFLARAAGLLGIEQPPPFPEVNRPGARESWGGSEADLAAIAQANQLDIAFYERARARLKAAAA